MTSTAYRPAAGRQLPPGPRGKAMLPKLVMAYRDLLGFMTSLAAEYGDAVRMPGPGRPLYLFNHPDHAKHVLNDNFDNYRRGMGLLHSRRALGDGLLTSEGELWHQQRRVAQPMFHRERMAASATLVAGKAEALAARLRRVPPGAVVEVGQQMNLVAFDVLSRTVLDTDVSDFAGLETAFDAVQEQAMFEMMTLSAVPTWLPLRRHRRFRRAVHDLEAASDRMTAGHDTVGNGLLAQMIASTRAEPDPAVRRRRLRDELVTWLITGSATTSTTVSWTWHLLDEHPEAFQRLHDEAVEVLGDRSPTYDDLPRLRYTTMVIHEALRLYPPIWILPRRAVEDDEIGGYHVPAGADVIICPYALHRHPAFWPAPEEFRPVRFDPELAGRRARYSYIPFSAGPRFCVGSNLGMLEAVFIIATVARELRLSKAPGHLVVPEPLMALGMRGGLPMTVHPMG